MKRLLRMIILAAGGLTVGGLLLTLGETLCWWRLWRHQVHLVSNHASEVGKAPRKAILWVSGVSDYGDSPWLPEQQAFVERLRLRSPGSVVVWGNVPADRDLDRRFRGGDVWRLLGLPHPPLWVWALHNFWQFALASVVESKYGRDIAQIMLQRLSKTGAAPGCPLLIVCGSAGAQIALAAAPFLRVGGHESIYMVALGGEFGSPHGLEAVTRFAQLTGEKDDWSKAGTWLFPGRWHSTSTCALAKNEGRLTIHSIGPHEHFGARSYLDDANVMPDGRTYAEAAFAAITQLKWWQEWTEL